MRSIWILPDRNQSGEMQVHEEGLTTRLCDALDLSRLPPSLVLGIPEEVLRHSPNDECVYAQLAKMGSSVIFCLSVVCGRDKTGRMVTLTNIQVLNEDEWPQLPPLPFDPSDPQIVERLSSLESHFTLPEDPINRKVKEMLDAARTFQSLKTFSSDRLISSANKPDWMPARTRSLSQSNAFFLIAAIIIAMLIMVVL